MTLNLGPEQDALRVGPRRPMPFPDSGRRVKLLLCPSCRNKGLLWYYAPYERGYKTQCIKCGQQAVIRRKGTNMREIQQAGGFTPRADGIRESARWGLDATKFYDNARDVRTLGYKRAYQQGLVPTPIDAKLR